MKRTVLLAFFSVFLLGTATTKAQFNEDELGAWYMYIFSGSFNAESPWGYQGDIQYRNWNTIGDLEQLLIRGAATYVPKNTNVKLALGYASITSGAFGDDDATSHESRIYQEANVPGKIGNKIALNHRFRYEQRFVDGQDFRTRYRYNLFVNIPFKGNTIVAKTWYASLYNEIFVNGGRDIGSGRTVEIFDRNRFYAAIGYAVKDNLKVQLGVMRQSTDNWSKNQLQLSLHHKL